MSAIHRLAYAGLGFSALALLAPPLPYRSMEIWLDVPGPALLLTSFALASKRRPRASWLAAGGLLLLLALPVVPYDQRTCSDVPKPYTMDFCDELGREWHPLAWAVILGRGFGYGDLGSVTWRAPWWAVAVAALWLVAFAIVATHWRPAVRSVVRERKPA